MMSYCETVKIKTDTNEMGYQVINAEDFDASKHELWTPDEPVVETPVVEKKARK
jgi:hypothetical protein